MLQDFKRIPVPLQKQTLIRAGIGISLLILSAVLIAVTRDIYLWLPCAAASVFSAVSAFLLYYRSVTGGYVVISGKCSEVGLTAVRRHTKYFILQTEACAVKVMLRNRLRKLTAGAAVKLYVAENTTLYEQNGTQMLYIYMALEVE